MSKTQVILAALMSNPILLIFLPLALPRPVSRWTNIIAADLLFPLNLVGLPTYPSAYDKFLLAMSMAFNLETVWHAWNWV